MRDGADVAADAVGSFDADAALADMSAFAEGLDLEAMGAEAVAKFEEFLGEADHIVDDFQAPDISDLS
jgi:hypothetical protein